MVLRLGSEVKHRFIHCAKICGDSFYICRRRCHLASYNFLYDVILFCDICDISYFSEQCPSVGLLLASCKMDRQQEDVFLGNGRGRLYPREFQQFGAGVLLFEGSYTSVLFCILIIIFQLSSGTKAASSYSHSTRLRTFSSFLFLFISLPNSALSLDVSLNNSCDMKNGASEEDATVQSLASMSFT